MATFSDLSIGDEFDFIDDANPTLSSFFDRCVKTSQRGYKGASTGQTYRVGSVRARVYHVTKGSGATKTATAKKAVDRPRR